MKSWLLPWVLVCMSLCVYPPRVAFLCPSVLWSFSGSSLTVLQNWMIRSFLLLLPNSQTREPDVGLRTLTFFSFFFKLINLFILISWRLITLQYCSGFCHTLTWISHGYTCIPHPDPPSHLPLHPIPLGLPSTPGPSTCLMHPTWAGDLFHPR